MDEGVLPVPFPSVGRIVHYVADGTPDGEYPAGVCRAAVVTELVTAGTPIIEICVLTPSGVYFNRAVPYDPDQKPGTWHWPERVI